MNMIIGIDASRNRSGGAIAHIVGIINEINPRDHGIDEIHIWSYKQLLDLLPNHSWLIKHNPNELEDSLFKQILWQYSSLPKELKSTNCSILFTTDASTFCRFRPMIVLSQDMLSYEPGVMNYFGYTKARLRLLAIKCVQNRAMKFADGVIFLTQYAANVIQKSCGQLPRIALVPHGVGEEFKQQCKNNHWPTSNSIPINCLYVSNAAMYKHQWVVVRAISLLRLRGHNIKLTLVGGGVGRAQELLEKQIAMSDPEGMFVNQMDFVKQNELPLIISNADLFIFASSCENMPVTLLEAMSVGLPIACSSRGPMPEVLSDGGIYFDPENDISIADAVEQIIVNPRLRLRISQQAKLLSEQYSWSRCSNETWDFIKNTYKNLQL